MEATSQKSRVLISCPKGIPLILGEEVRKLGFPVLAEKEAGVETEATLADTMKLNLWLRTGHRVLFLLKSFHAATADALYWQVQKIAWEDYIPLDGYFTVDCAVETQSIRDIRFASLRCKDAIADRFRHRCGRRPDSGSEAERAAVFLYWRGHDCSVYLNTTGVPLAKRGYRRIPLDAPMQETLAAAVVLATGWQGDTHFVNPMCGSGTLAIEAALAGIRKAPGLMRQNFAFMHLKEFDAKAWSNLRARAEAAFRVLPRGRIIATDIRTEAVAAARRNARDAGVDDLIAFGECDFADTPVPEAGSVVVLNPGYGARMGQADLLAGDYRRIGDFFKQSCQGCTGYVFTGNAQLAKSVGLRSSRRIPFFSGQMECRLLRFDMYPGTKRVFRACPPAGEKSL